MQPYPHRYAVNATGAAAGHVVVACEGVCDMETAPPTEFDGPGDRWSPETLLCAAVADCTILSFRAIARASRFEWLQIQCRTEGTLDRVDGKARFVGFASHVQLTVPAGADAARARQLVEKAEHGCLISNSLIAERTLSVDVQFRS